MEKAALTTKRKTRWKKTPSDSRIKRAEGGDQDALAQVRQPIAEQLAVAASACDLARLVELSWVKVIAGESPLVRAVVESTLNRIKASLTGTNPLPLERLLVDRIVVCWLQVQYADSTYATSVGKVSLGSGEYFQRRQDRAHRRYLSAVRTLANVRRLLLPPLQINVAENQVVANSSAQSPQSLASQDPDSQGGRWGSFAAHMTRKL